MFLEVEVSNCLVKHLLDGGLCSQEERFVFIASREGLSLLGFPEKHSLRRHILPKWLIHKVSGNERRGHWVQRRESRGGGETEPRVPGCAGEWWTGLHAAEPAEQSHPPEPWKRNVSPRLVSCGSILPRGCELPPVHLSTNQKGPGSRTGG